jgi:hypothetical protein
VIHCNYCSLLCSAYKYRPNIYLDRINQFSFHQNRPTTFLFGFFVRFTLNEFAVKRVATSVSNLILCAFGPLRRHIRVGMVRDERGGDYYAVSGDGLYVGNRCLRPKPVFTGCCVTIFTGSETLKVQLFRAVGSPEGSALQGIQGNY